MACDIAVSFALSMGCCDSSPSSLHSHLGAATLCAWRQMFVRLVLALYQLPYVGAALRAGNNRVLPSAPVAKACIGSAHGKLLLDSASKLVCIVVGRRPGRTGSTEAPVAGRLMLLLAVCHIPSHARIAGFRQA